MTMRDRDGATPSTYRRTLFSLRMISLSKRDTLEYTSADVLVRCDDRDSLRHANSVREQVQRQPPRFRSSLSSASELPAPPVCFSFPRQRSCSRATFIASRTSRNYPAAKSAPPTHAPHVCARLSHDTSVSAPRSRGPFKKQKRRGKKMMGCARETETVESFQRERRRGWLLSSLSSTTTIHF